MTQRQPIKHGTDGGYQAHVKYREPMCEPCRAVHTQKLREWHAVEVVCRDCGQFRPRGSKGRCVACYKRRLRAAAKRARG
jgi:hypothetical protein